MECFTAVFCYFLVQMSKFTFWVAGWVLGINSKHLIANFEHVNAESVSVSLSELINFYWDHFRMK